MKKYIKYLLILFMLIPIININAKIDSEDVNYSVEKLYMNGEIEIAGGFRVKELIVVKGSLNGYIRDIYYEDSSLKDFDKTVDSFYSSKIYNGSSPDIYEIGIGHENIDNISEFTQTYIDENITMLDAEEENTYETTEENGYKSIKIYNETNNDYAVFYLDYVVPNIVVEHNDIAEFYYPLIGKNFEDKIKELYVQVLLPFADEDIKVWAHGPLSGESFILEGGAGAVLKVNDLYKTTTDLRIAYNKEYFMININESKKSGVDAMPLILEVEEKKADEANAQRNALKALYYTVFGISIIFIISLVYLIFYIYKRYDKEHDSTFKEKYNREFIDDYPVEMVEYLFNKNISSKAFTASLLNLIYKKNIDVIKEGKKDYKLTFISDKDLSENEKKIITLLFDEIGSNKTVLISQIKKESKNTSYSGKNTLYDGFISWKNNVIADSTLQNFYENRGKEKIKFVFYSLIGYILLFVGFKLSMNFILLIILGLSTTIFLLYVVTFTQKTVKGNTDYRKWKAFKNFLNDFGRFNEKELPEIKLWERYLVYASIFGLANKVQKAMKIKFDELRPNYSSRNTLFDYMIFSSFANDFSSSVNNSINSSIASVASSKSSSGSGGGGGFSGGSSFSGGGGGHGF